RPADIWAAAAGFQRVAGDDRVADRERAAAEDLDAAACGDAEKGGVVGDRAIGERRGRGAIDERDAATLTAAVIVNRAVDDGHNAGLVEESAAGTGGVILPISAESAAGHHQRAGRSGLDPESAAAAAAGGHAGIVPDCRIGDGGVALDMD